eukprot:2927474-Amphidinium_carterae.1
MLAYQPMIAANIGACELLSCPTIAYCFIPCPQSTSMRVQAFLNSDVAITGTPPPSQDVRKLQTVKQMHENVEEAPCNACIVHSCFMG